jgi:hypothetical protein
MCPLTPISCATLFETEIDVNGNMYIAKMTENGNLAWVLCDDARIGKVNGKSPKKVFLNKNKVQTIKNGFPLTPIECVSLYETEVGIDGNEYIAQMVNGKLAWMLQDNALYCNTTEVISVTLPNNNSKRRMKSAKSSR